MQHIEVTRATHKSLLRLGDVIRQELLDVLVQNRHSSGDTVANNSIDGAGDEGKGVKELGTPLPVRNLSGQSTGVGTGGRWVAGRVRVMAACCLQVGQRRHGTVRVPVPRAPNVDWAPVAGPSNPLLVQDVKGEC
jgi:hypothetical protein